MGVTFLFIVALIAIYYVMGINAADTPETETADIVISILFPIYGLLYYIVHPTDKEGKIYRNISAMTMVVNTIAIPIWFFVMCALYW